MRFLQIFSLPLLTKELIEQAQNKRTYIFRVVVASILYGAALLSYRNITGGGAQASVMNLGRGRALFQLLAGIEFSMILLLLPPLTCGALTVEKEKDTLALLLLTKLSPWTIVFEKFLSRVFALTTYQLLALPLFAIAYGLGGVELAELIVMVSGLFALTLVVGAISILCSTWFRTTSAAFVMTYVCLFLMTSCMTTQLVSIFGPFLRASSVMFAAMNSDSVLSFVVRFLGPGSVQVLVQSVFLGLAIIFSGSLLYLASRVLVARAFVPVRNLVLDAFRHADRFFNELNRWTTGGIVLVPDREVLPEFDAISWRETRKKSLGTFRYQFRVLMLLLTPLMFVIAYFLTDGRSDFTSPFRGFPVYFWIITIICLTIHSTNAIPSERIRQSLEVLLVAPMSGREIVYQKLAGVRRMIMILSIPFIILIGFQAIWTGYVIQGLWSFQSSVFWKDIIITSLSTLIYMPLIMWIGFQMGLRMKTQIQAVLATFAIIGATCAFPEILLEIVSMFIRSLGLEPFGLLVESSPYDGSVLRLLTALVESLSPVNLILRKPPLFDERSNGLSWFLIAFHFSLYGWLWWTIRKNAYLNFSRIVGRLEPNPIATDDALNRAA